MRETSATRPVRAVAIPAPSLVGESSRTVISAPGWTYAARDSSRRTSSRNARVSSMVSSG